MLGVGSQVDTHPLLILNVVHITVNVWYDYKSLFIVSEVYCFEVYHMEHLLYTCIFTIKMIPKIKECIIFIVCRYIPVLMAQAKIYWDLENYSQVEKIFRKSVEFCNESDIWKLNVAHVLFMQENKFKEATGFYEPIVKKNYDNVRTS